MKLYSKQEAIARMNMLAGCSKSFVFLIDYSQEQVYVEETAEVSPEELIYNLNGFTNEAVAGLTDELLPESLPEQIEWIAQPVSFQEYSRAFGHVKKNILAGNSFLTNLTCRTPVQTNLTLKDIYCNSRALYKVWVNESFCSFLSGDFCSDKERDYQLLSHERYDRRYPARCRTNLDERRERSGGTCYDCGSDQE